MNDLSKSSSVFAEAKQYIPGGVNSPVRSFRSVGGVPPFIAKGAGSKLYDLDGNEYIDYVLSYGPLLLGHAHPVVTEAVQAAAAKGTSFGAPTGAEVTLAKLVCELVSSMDMVRMVNSGTEATMSAIRLARAYTGRDCIVKFIGCYHGHSDALLVHAGSGATAGTLAEAQRAVGRIVGRDTENLSRREVLCAAIETVAEDTRSEE